MTYHLASLVTKSDRARPGKIQVISPRARRARGLVSKIAIREAILSWWRKDFGGARILAELGEAWEGGQRGKVGGRGGQGIRRAVCPSVCCGSN